MSNEITTPREKLIRSLSDVRVALIELEDAVFDVDLPNSEEVEQLISQARVKVAEARRLLVRPRFSRPGSQGPA